MVLIVCGLPSGHCHRLCGRMCHCGVAAVPPGGQARCTLQPVVGSVVLCASWRKNLRLELDTAVRTDHRRTTPSDCAVCVKSVTCAVYMHMYMCAPTLHIIDT